MGRLGKDPELRRTKSDKAVCSFSVATTTYGNSSGEKKESTEWSNVVCWEKTAENAAKYLSKGKQVLVEGRLQTRSWEDKQGQKKYTTEIIAHNVQFVGGGRQDQSQESRPAPAKEDKPFDPLNDVPF